MSTTTPALRPPLHPEPDGFEDRILLGHILGEPVYGEQTWDIVTGRADRYTVRYTANGLTVDCANGRLCIQSHENLEGMPLADVARLVELWQAGAIQALAAIARRWLGEQ